MSRYLPCCGVCARHTTVIKVLSFRRRTLKNFKGEALQSSLKIFEISTNIYFMVNSYFAPAQLEVPE
jgi:hypothetical protein